MDEEEADMWEEIDREMEIESPILPEEGPEHEWPEPPDHSAGLGTASQLVIV